MTNLYSIPVGVIDDQQIASPRIPMSKRIPGKVVATARIAPEKRLDHLARAVAMAHEKVSEISLDLYGYADNTDNFAAKRAVEAVIEEFGAQDYIKLYDYTTDVALVHQTAQIFGVTSIMEGFNIAIMEAMGQGDVGLTYNVNYGPNDIVVDGKNGYIVALDDVDALADRLVELLTDAKLLQQLSDGAYELSNRFSESTVWSQWQELLADAKKTWPNKLADFQHRDIDHLTTTTTPIIDESEINE